MFTHKISASAVSLSFRWDKEERALGSLTVRGSSPTEIPLDDDEQAFLLRFAMRANPELVPHVVVSDSPESLRAKIRELEAEPDRLNALLRDSARELEVAAEFDQKRGEEIERLSVELVTCHGRIQELEGMPVPVDRTPEVEELGGRVEELSSELVSARGTIAELTSTLEARHAEPASDTERPVSLDVDGVELPFVEPEPA